MTYLDNELKIKATIKNPMNQITRRKALDMRRTSMMPPDARTLSNLTPPRHVQYPASNDEPLAIMALVDPLLGLVKRPDNRAAVFADADGVSAYGSATSIEQINRLIGDLLQIFR